MSADIPLAPHLLQVQVLPPALRSELLRVHPPAAAALHQMGVDLTALKGGSGRAGGTKQVRRCLRVGIRAEVKRAQPAVGVAQKVQFRKRGVSGGTVQLAADAAKQVRCDGGAQRLGGGSGCKGRGCSLAAGGG